MERFSVFVQFIKSSNSISWLHAHVIFVVVVSLLLTSLLLFYVGPTTDEGEDDTDPRDSDDESKTTKGKVSSRKRTKGSSFPHDL